MMLGERKDVVVQAIASKRSRVGFLTADSDLIRPGIPI
jgi:hypothetical protein